MGTGQKDRRLNTVSEFMEKTVKRLAQELELARKFSVGERVIPYEAYIKILRMHEQIYLELRKHPSYGMQRQSEMFEATKGERILDINMEDEILKIRFPCLLPARDKETRAVKCLYALCYQQLSDWWMEHGMLRFNKAVLCFEYVYGKEERYRDYDNYESKAVKDMVTRLFLPDDSPKYCSVFQTARKGEEGMTYVYVVSPKKFEALWRKWI